MSSLETTFTTFYEGWFNRHHDLQQKLTTNNEKQLRKLVEQASKHYHEYYQEKLTLIEEDVFLVCSPPWFTSFEQALFWVTDFPPSLLFRFIKDDLNMTNDQSSKVESMKADTARQETEIDEAMAMVQESLADAPLYGLVNRAERLVDGEVSKLDNAMEDVKEAMREVIAEADGLRMSVVKGVLEVLDEVQRVKFFAAVGQFRIRVRQVGLQMMATQTL